MFQESKKSPSKKAKKAAYRTRSPSGKERRLRQVVVIEDSVSSEDDARVLGDDTTNGEVETVIDYKPTRGRGHLHQRGTRDSRRQRDHRSTESIAESMARRIFETQKRDWCKGFIIFFVAVAAILMAYYVGRIVVENKEDGMTMTVAESSAYCLPNRIQERNDVTLYMALEGLTSEQSEEYWSHRRVGRPEMIQSSER